MTVVAEAGCDVSKSELATGLSLKSVHTILDWYLSRITPLAEFTTATFENVSNTDFADRLQTKGNWRARTTVATNLWLGLPRQKICFDADHSGSTGIGVSLLVK